MRGRGHAFHPSSHPLLLTTPSCFLSRPHHTARSGLIQRIFSMPTMSTTPWDHYDTLTLLAIKTVPFVQCGLDRPGCWTYGPGDVNFIHDYFAAEVGEVVRRTRRTLAFLSPPTPDTYQLPIASPHPSLPTPSPAHLIARSSLDF